MLLYRVECTLFGTYVDELNAFLSTREVQNVVISIEDIYMLLYLS